jgi:hypothetical protein
MGLQTDANVAFQLPNTVESVLTLLGVLRAGMIAVPLPLLWRRADMAATLARIDAKVLIACSRVGAVDHCDIALRVAAEVFPIRYVCGFGRKLPDGMVPFDDLFTGKPPDPIPSFERERAPDPGAHIAAITWDVTADGMVPVARDHHELLAGGVAVALEGRLERDTVILSAVPTTSFAGLSLALLPWLLNGGTLCLHQPFEPSVMAAQLRERKCQAAILPGPLIARLAEGGYLDARDGLKNVLALWRAPERLPASPAWRQPLPVLIDVQAFGEAALIAARRGDNGRPAPIAVGRLSAPRGAANGVHVAELVRSDAGTVALRSPMIPCAPFPPGAERGALPYFKVGPDGTFDTGYTCRFDTHTRTMVVTGPPAGIVGVGGYRFVMSELQELVGRAGGNAVLAAFPDSLAGQRLAGTADDRTAVQNALARFGANPLVVAAFRGRRGGERTTGT